jgi:hypothetical protein
VPGPIDQGEVPDEVVGVVRSICLALPEVYEEQAWTGTRWRVRARTFAHVLLIDAGWPPVYAREAGTDGPVCVLMFRSSGIEVDVLRRQGIPFFAPVWRDDEVGLMLGDEVDWAEVTGLLTESYCVVAPKKLARAVLPPIDD